MFLHPHRISEPMSVEKALMDVLPSEIKEIQPALKKDWYNKPYGSLGKFLTVRKLNRNKPAYTLIATHKGCARIHWSTPRWLSVSECVRLQSFPSNYQFLKAPFRIIGNSVPPLMMKAIANHLKTLLPKEDDPTVIGLFTGGGGSSMGFDMAGFNELLAVDFNKNATETFKLNFPNKLVLNQNIQTLTGETILNLTKLDKGELFCLQGSPPCQGFSTAGKMDFQDKRNYLYLDMVRITRELQPKFIVMENVRGLAMPQNRLHLQNMVNEFTQAGYTVQQKLMNAMYYNVPQARRRLIIIGVRNDLIHKLTN